MSKSKSLTKILAKEKFMANKMMTRKSLTTVTPIAVWVNGPLARISLIIAMAEEGDRATKMVAVNIATAIFASELIPFIK